MLLNAQHGSGLIPKVLPKSLSVQQKRKWGRLSGDVDSEQAAPRPSRLGCCFIVYSKAASARHSGCLIRTLAGPARCVIQSPRGAQRWPSESRAMRRLQKATLAASEGFSPPPSTLPYVFNCYPIENRKGCYRFSNEGESVFGGWGWG